MNEGLESLTRHSEVKRSKSEASNYLKSLMERRISTKKQSGYKRARIKEIKERKL